MLVLQHVRHNWCCKLKTHSHWRLQLPDDCVSATSSTGGCQSVLCDHDTPVEITKTKQEKTSSKF